MKNLLILAALLFSISSFSQELTGNQLLEKAIQYHDPNGNWSTFKGTLLVTMEIHQFFHDETKNDGEYILLSKEETINGLKLPKNRAWFTNKEEKHLGTDILKAAN